MHSVLSAESLCRSAFLVLLLFLSVHFAGMVHAQVLDVKTFPFIEVVLPHQITSPNDGMGLLELAVDDLVRGPFVNPAKANLVKRDYLLLSGNLGSYQIEAVNVTSGTGGSEAIRNEKGSKNIFPVAGIYRLGWLRIGGLASYLNSSSYADNRQTGVGPPVRFNLDLRGTGYPFELIAGFSIDEKIGLGLSYGQSDIKTSGSLSFTGTQRDREQSTVASNYRLGAVYDEDEEVRISVVGVRYNLNDNLTDRETANPSSTHREETNGWAIQGEYRRDIDHIGQVSFGATVDIRQQSERSATGSTIDSESGSDAKLYRFGIGATRKEGNLVIAGEIMYEPAWISVKSPPVGSPSLKTEWKFKNWRARFGFGAKLADWCEWKGGVEYLSFRNSSQEVSTATSTKIDNDPYASQGRTTLTTGMQLRLGQISVLYNLLYSSSSYTGLLVAASNNFNFLAPFEVKPITHRLYVAYEFH